MTSESSDEENLELLKEAQDTQFINDSMFTDSPEKSTAENSSEKNIKKQLPSLRKSRNDDEQFNFLKVTPEFRSYVAKQLSSILDSKLSKRFADLEDPEKPRKKRKTGGVKLLSDSTQFLKTGKVNAENGISATHNCKAKFIKNNKELDSAVPEDLLKEAAVSAEDILSKKEVKNWSKRSKAPVFHYKKGKNGQLELMES